MFSRISSTTLLFVSILLLVGCARQTTDPEIARLEARAETVTIIRDDFGVPHIYAKTDADAVFGMLYAQSEDDFNRVERNYIWATGRLAEVEGEDRLRVGTRLAASTLRCLRRRRQLLPVHAPRGAASPADALRTLDANVFQ
jgi:acyl-homoserine lactone acylase PvdQ